RAPVVGPVPSGAHRAELLEQLAEAVEDIDPRPRVARRDADDVPGVVVAVAVGREVRRVVYHPHPKGHAAAAVDVPDGDGMLARGHVLKDVAVLEGAVVQLVLIGPLALCKYLDRVVIRERPVQQVGPIGKGRGGDNHRRAHGHFTAGGQLGDQHGIDPALERNDRGPGLAHKEYAVKLPLEGVQGRIQPRVNNGRGRTAAYLWDRVAVLVHAKT